MTTMKKTFIAALVICCTVLNTVAQAAVQRDMQNKYTITFDISDYSVKEYNGLIVINTSTAPVYYATDPALPAIPYTSQRILRPEGVKDFDYNITFEKVLVSEGLPVEGNAPVVSTAAPQDYAPIRKSASKDVTTPVLYHGLKSRYGYQYAYFELAPFIYESKGNKLYFIPSVTIEIADEMGQSQTEAPATDKRAHIMGKVINPDELDAFYALENERNVREENLPDRTPSHYYDYLIITSSSLAQSHSGAYDFHDLAAWKMRRGVKTKIITLDSIYSTAPSILTNPMKIRYFVKRENEYHNIKWVLLGGTEDIVPTLHCRAGYTGNNGLTTEDVPTDMYYSCTNSIFDWDFNGNGIYGELDDGVNFTPVVYVSRIPVHSTTDVHAFVQKLIRYESNPDTGNYANKMAFAGLSLGHSVGNKSETHYQSEAMYTLYVGPYKPSSGHDYVYDTGYSLPGYTPLTATKMSNLINQGYHFIHLMTHGTSTSWELAGGLFPTYYNSSYAQSQTNQNNTIFSGVTCNFNDFSNSSCLSNYILCSTWAGGIAMFGSSADGLNKVTYSNPTTLSNPVNQSLLYDGLFYKKLFTANPSYAPYHFASVVADVKEDLADHAEANDYDGYRYLQFGINPLGDPEMPIYTTTPLTFQNVTVTNSGNNVTVSTGGVSGCTITIVNADNAPSTYYGCAKDVSSYTFTDVVSPFCVTVSKPGYKPYLNDGLYALGEIIGNTCMCGDEVYYVDNLPEYVNVAWSFQNQSSLNSLISQDYPDEGQCYVSLSDSLVFTDNLVATVYKNNHVVGVKTKNIRSRTNFSGTYRVGTYNSGDTIYSNPLPLHDRDVITISTYCPSILIKSDYLYNPSLTLYPTTNYYYVDNETVCFTFPFIPTGTGRLIKGICNNSCWNFTIFVISFPPGTASALAVNHESGYLDVAFIKARTSNENGFEAMTDWRVEVVNASTGHKVYDAWVEETSQQISTAGWSRGVYIIKGICGNDVQTQKISVK